jgi:hypothetical protein
MSETPLEGAISFLFPHCVALLGGEWRHRGGRASTTNRPTMRPEHDDRPRQYHDVSPSTGREPGGHISTMIPCSSPSC